MAIQSPPSPGGKWVRYPCFTQSKLLTSLMDSFTAPVHFSAQTGAAPLLLHRERWTSSSIIPKPRRCNSVISISVFHSQAGADNVSPVWSLDKMMVLHELKSQGDTKFPAFSVHTGAFYWYSVIHGVGGEKMSPAVTSARWDQPQLWFFMSCIHTLTQMLPGVPSAKCSLCDTHIHTRLQTDLQQERVAAANRGKLMFVLRRQVFHCKLPRQSLKMPGFTASRFPAACPHPLYDTFQRLQPTQNALVKVAWSWIKRAPRRTEEVSALCRNIPTSLTVFFF